MDGDQCGVGRPCLWPLSLYSSEFGPLLCGSHSGTADYDEPESAGGRRAENDYKVNLKTEIMIEDLYDKVNLLLARQAELEKGCKEPEKKPTWDQGAVKNTAPFLYPPGGLPESLYIW